MQPVAPFLLLYAATIVLARIGLWSWPRHAPKIGGFQPHHYMYGLVLMALYLALPHWWLLAAGLGLFVDEAPLFFIFKGVDWPDNHWRQYQSIQSVLFILAISLAGYLAFTFLAG